jgi:endonuclease/exonuclease/phosphatase family metal-dependent hydrolase
MRIPRVVGVLFGLALLPAGCSATPDDARSPDAAATGADAHSADAGDLDAGKLDVLTEDSDATDSAADASEAAARDAHGAGDAGITIPDGGTRLRIMAANTTTGTRQSYDPGEGIRIFQGIRPDVALVQEVNYGTNSTDDIRAFVDLAFGTGFVYFREPTISGGLPNALVSRYPILESGEWDDPRVTNREFAWAHIDVPGPVDLWAVSVHLLTTSATNRQLEAAALVTYIQSNVPAGDFLVIGGDFNTADRAEPCLTTFASITDTGAPYPVDQNGNSFTTENRSKPTDWVLEAPLLRAVQIPVVIGASVFPDGLVVDSRVYNPLPEIAPVLLGDSAADGMQHMAVVKDFALAADVP